MTRIILSHDARTRMISNTRRELSDEGLKF